jgi:hypothetical protein
MGFKSLIEKELENRNNKEVSRQLECKKRINENNSKITELVKSLMKSQEEAIKNLSNLKEDNSKSNNAMVIPVQIHKMKDNVKIFSLNDIDISSNFPSELVDSIKLMSESEFVIDGYILNFLEKHFIIPNDLLYLDGSLVEKSLSERADLIKNLRITYK